MGNEAPNLIWVDCEMTGLDVAIDEIVEIAVIITDSNLVPRHEGLSLVIKPSPAALNNMGDFVREMHTNSGLITELDAGLPLAEAETLVLEYLAAHVPEGRDRKVGPDNQKSGAIRGLSWTSIPILRRLHQ